VIQSAYEPMKNPMEKVLMQLEQTERKIKRNQRMSELSLKQLEEDMLKNGKGKGETERPKKEMKTSGGT